MALCADSIAALDHVRRLAGARKRVVFVSGNFNIVHPGHLRLLRFAAGCGDLLVVGVRQDGVDGIIVPEQHRLEGVRSISFVNFAFILRDPVEQFIAALKPAIVVKGKEHENLVNSELPALSSYGGKLLFSSGDVVFSSVDLLRSEIFDGTRPLVRKPRDFAERHGFSIGGLKDVVSKYSGLRVVVVGDMIVDEYINCDPLGMSQEDPTIVVTPVQQDRFIGGAAIVAAHAKCLGASVRFLTVAGPDAALAFARDELGKHGVEGYFAEDESRPTTLKQRFRAGGKTLLRVSHLRQHDINRDIAGKLLKEITSVLASTDLLMFSDFNYGCLPEELVEGVIAACRRRSVMMVADSQSSSQIGDVSRFKGMQLLTPTEREARLAMRDFNSGLAVLAENLRQKAQAENVIVTLGAEGMLIHAPVHSGREWHTDRIPAMNTAPRDPAGAGDSLFSCASMALAVGATIWQSAYLGAVAAACQVSRVGNTPLNPRDIELELQE